MREQLTIECGRFKEFQENSNCRIRTEECQRSTLEEKLEKACAELQHMRDDHLTLADYLCRLARALCWADCVESPGHGPDTNTLAQQLLDRAEQLTMHNEHVHGHGVCDKSCPEHHYYHHHLPKIRRERSCHDIPLKEVMRKIFLGTF